MAIHVGLAYMKCARPVQLNVYTHKTPQLDMPE